MKKSGFTTLLKNRNFLKLWGVQSTSLVCSYMLVFILMGRIYQATGSTMAVGLLWGFYILPSVVLGLFIGVFLDYFSKKDVLVFSNLFQALIVLFFLGIGQEVWPIYTLVLLYSLCDEFFNPAVGVLLPSLVRKRELPAANGFFLFTTQGSLVLGSLIGGLILRFFNKMWFPFILASIFLFLATLLASFLKRDKPVPQKLEASITGFGGDLVEGYSFIKNEPKVLFPVVLLAGLQIILGMSLILLPTISSSILKIEFADSPLILIIPAILGAILGSFVVERTLRKYLKRVLIINGLLFLGISILILGFVPAIRFLAVIGALLAFLAGASFVLMLIPLQVLVQENTPFDIRGRVFSTLNTLITLAAVIPVLTTVTLVDVIGVRLILTISGLGLITLALYAARGRYGILPTYYRT